MKGGVASEEEGKEGEEEEGEEEEATDISLRSSGNSGVLKTVIKNSITGVDPLLHTPDALSPSPLSLPSLSPLCNIHQETHGSRPGAVVVHYSRFSKGRPVTQEPGGGGGGGGPLVGRCVAAPCVITPNWALRETDM